MQKAIPFFILITILAVLGIASCCINCPNPSQAGEPADVNADVGSIPDPPGEPSGQIIDGVRVIKMTAERFRFEPSVITVNQGDKVRLEITSKDVTHGFAMKEYKISRKLKPGQTELIAFIADKPGTFNFHCNVFCGVGHLGMKGKLTVLPK
jgi:cytochrome c oxidase subunit 2